MEAKCGYACLIQPQHLPSSTKFSLVQFISAYYMSDPVLATENTNLETQDFLLGLSISYEVSHRSQFLLMGSIL